MSSLQLEEQQQWGRQILLLVYHSVLLLWSYVEAPVQVETISSGPPGSRVRRQSWLCPGDATSFRTPQSHTRHRHSNVAPHPVCAHNNAQIHRSHTLTDTCMCLLSLSYILIHIHAYIKTDKSRMHRSIALAFIHVTTDACSRRQINDTFVYQNNYLLMG